MAKLAVILKQRELEGKRQQVKNAWREHNKMIRGNPVRVYEGMYFLRKI